MCRYTYETITKETEVRLRAIAEMHTRQAGCKPLQNMCQQWAFSTLELWFALTAGEAAAEADYVRLKAINTEPQQGSEGNAGNTPYTLLLNQTTQATA